MAFNIIKVLRSITAGSRPSGRTYGEPYVNLSDNQFGVFDSSNVARDLVGVPFFSSATTYTSGQPVNYQGQLYVANTSITAAAWNPAQWNLVTGKTTVLAIKLFTVSGTYTPTAGMTCCIIECVGGGAGGNGQAGNASQYIIGGGGGSGAYARKLATAAQIGASQPVTIGAGGGGGGGSSTSAGGAGGDTSVGTLCVAKGAPSSGTGYVPGTGGNGPTSVGDVRISGQSGGFGCAINNNQGGVPGGAGGNSMLGSGAPQTSWTTTTQTGGGAFGPGGGGGGGTIGIAGGVSGGPGGAGVAIITEFA